MNTAPVMPEDLIRVRVTCGLSAHGRVCSNDVVRADLLDSHLAVVAYTHGKVSGMDSGVKVQYRLARA